VARQSGGSPRRFNALSCFPVRLDSLAPGLATKQQRPRAVIQLDVGLPAVLSGSSVPDRANSRSFACKHESASSQGEADRAGGVVLIMKHAQKYLAQANRQIAELTVQLAHQRAVVKHAVDTGQRSEITESLLDALEGSVRLFEKHRIFLLSRSGAFSALLPGDAATGRSLSRRNGREVPF
jgi:hypothetical protein